MDIQNWKSHWLSNPSAMKMGAELLKRMDKTDGKYPKLKELYDAIFGTDIREIHNAVYDVFLTSKLYHYMLSVKHSSKI